MLKNRLKQLTRINYQNDYLLKRELSLFENCNNILDIGCGDGQFIALSPKRISGIDNNRDTVKDCVKRGLRVMRGNAIKLPYKDNSFDGVHCAHLIEHFRPNDAYKMLKEVGRVLKKDGIFVLSTPLLWAGFFEDFTHIKPYYPNAILRYLVHEASQPTMDTYPYRFEQIVLYYRFRPLWLPTKIGRLLSNRLYTFHIHTPFRDAYTLALRKLS